MEYWGFLVAILLGALIGLQREYEQHHSKISRFAGIRTFIIISLIGAILGFISVEIIKNNFLIILGFIAIVLFSSLSYYITYMKYGDNGATTEISALIVYFVGVLSTIGFLKLAVIIAVILTALLTFKEKIHKLPKNIQKKELFAVVQFAIISLVILPLIPNKSFSPLDLPALADLLLAFNVPLSVLQQLDIFNFYQIWFMVILIAGISFLGYIMVKFFGSDKGYGITGFLGGLASSTAVTLSMSAESKKYSYVNPLVVAVVLATATSYIRVLIEVVVINKNLLSTLITPFILMSFLGYIISFFIYFRSKKKESKKNIVEIKQPFALMPAIKFGLFFIFVIFLAKILQIFAGSTGLYIASLVSGIADVDAITLTMASLSKSGNITNQVAVISIVLAAASNTFVKGLMTWFLGEKKFALYTSIVFFVILLAGLGTVLFM